MAQHGACHVMRHQGAGPDQRPRCVLCASHRGGVGEVPERTLFDSMRPALDSQLLCAVTLIHQTSTDQSLTQDSGSIFRVRWHDGRYPNSEDRTCENGCIAVGLESCICETTVETSAVFTGMAHLPSVAGVEAELLIGSAPPEAFAPGVYAECSTVQCATSRAAGVTIYLHSSGGANLDAQSIFRIHLNSTLGGSWTRPVYLANKASIVRVGSGAFAFRNPPKFHSFVRPSQRDAEHETDALIDHLAWHKNV